MIGQDMPYSAHNRAVTRPWARNGIDARRNGTERATGPQARKATKALECSICTVRYSREDVLMGLFQITTKVCSECYSCMQAAPHKVHCFGKPDVIQSDGTRLLGYSRTARECQELCPDRALCASVVDPETYNPDYAGGNSRVIEAKELGVRL